MPTVISSVRVIESVSLSEVTSVISNDRMRSRVQPRLGFDEFWTELIFPKAL